MEIDFSDSIISFICFHISPVPRKTKSVPKRSLEPKKNSKANALELLIFILLE
ncbi:hypothetical protein SK637_00049 [Streptococcus mitis]|nr:hypothetical protein SMSK321_0361 [Streptococcus mitis SK321]QBZ12649.1 hypothetical protein SK637_00049 [Streptococcus mitis]